MSFSKNFIIGAGTASYQIEGAWNVDGKGENIWDRLCHEKPESVVNNENGDVACDSYSKYLDDVGLVRELGFKMYRFSISWARIMPDGDITNINEAGVKYYHNLIDELLRNGIDPMVTIYHWDLPQKLQNIGGWANPLIADYFEDYADLLFKIYGNKVKWWITINEPTSIILGYCSANFAPGLKMDSPIDYVVMHNLLRAHGRAYRLYDEKYRHEQNGKISLAIQCFFCQEKSQSPEDLEAAKRALTFVVDWTAHPVYSKQGDYPEILRQLVDDNSRKEGRRRSKLPKFTKDEIECIKGSYDFFALNYYTTFLCSTGPHNTFFFKHNSDVNFSMSREPEWLQAKSNWLNVVPWGLRQILCYIKDQYDNPPVFITENGYSDQKNKIGDPERISYHQEHLLEVANAIENYNCNVIGYIAWTLIDNFEWVDGYEARFGLVHVDFDDPQRKRTLKESAKFFKNLNSTHSIPA